MYELLIFIALSVGLECGMGIIYGVGVGYDPWLVFPAAILINFATVIVALCLIERILNWKKGLRDWLERRTARGKKAIDKYGSVGIVVGILFLSPVQLAILGRLIGMKSTKLVPALLCAICLVATAFLCVSLGVFKVLLA